jgi:hypothetical protein
VGTEECCALRTLSVTVPQRSEAACRKRIDLGYYRPEACGLFRSVDAEPLQSRFKQRDAPPDLLEISGSASALATRVVGEKFAKTIALPMSLGYSQAEVVAALDIPSRSVKELMDELRDELTT